MRAAFVSAISNIYTLIKEPSPALSGTLSHPASLALRRTGEGEYCNDLNWGEGKLFAVGVGPIEFSGLGGDEAGLQGALFDGGHRRDLAVISG